MKKDHRVCGCERERERGEEVEGNGGLVTTDKRVGPLLIQIYIYIYYFFLLLLSLFLFLLPRKLIFKE